MSTKEAIKTSIGGQALIEGIMMRGPKTSGMAVRLPDGSISLDTWETNKGGVTPWYKKTPFIRGCFNFVDTMVTGYKCLMQSAEKSGFDLEEPTEFEKKLAKLLGKNLTTVVSTLAVVLGTGLAVLLFMVLPSMLTGLVSSFIGTRLGLSTVEGLIKIGIFLLYIAGVAQVPDIKRVFEYHGAEHKTIACYEDGKELTVENIKGYTRFHPRCGTSFLLIVMVVSILVSSVVTWDNLLFRILLKLLMLPVVVSISYEIIKAAGRYDNFLTRIISAPGLWLQRLTTNEPDASQIEVAIAAMQPCIPEDRNDDRW